MKTTKKATKAQGANIANNKPTKATANNLKQVSSKTEVTKKVSNYTLQVIESNNILKQESKTIGFCIKVILNNIKLLPNITETMVKNLNAINMP